MVINIEKILYDKPSGQQTAKVILYIISEKNFTS